MKFQLNLNVVILPYSQKARRVLFMFLGPNVRCFYREDVSGIQICNSYKPKGGRFFFKSTLK